MLKTYESQAKDSQGALVNHAKMRKNENLLTLTSSDLQKSNKNHTTQSLSSSNRNSKSSKSIQEDQNNLILATDGDIIPIKGKTAGSPNNRCEIDK